MLLWLCRREEREQYQVHDVQQDEREFMDARTPI